MAQPRHFQQRPPSMEEKLNWIYDSSTSASGRPSNPSVKVNEISPQEITQLRAKKGFATGNITPPVVFSPQLDHDFRTRPIMNEQIIGVQPSHITSNPGRLGQNVGEVQQKPEDMSIWPSFRPQPPPPGTMETLVSTHPLYSGPRRDPQNHFTGFYMLPTTVPTETDPLGSERVRVAEHKEVQRRQVERNHEQPKEVLGQAGSSRPPPTEARKSYGEHMGWPQFSHQPQDPKQAPIAISGLSTCYYWDKHQNDSKQPPCHMGITCRSLHRHVQGVPIAPAPNSDSQSTNTAAIDARKARATAKVHSAQRNPPFINLPPLLNYPLRDERHIGVGRCHHKGPQDRLLWDPPSAPKLNSRSLKCLFPQDLKPHHPHFHHTLRSA
jgi:hypothetical protein